MRSEVLLPYTVVTVADELLDLLCKFPPQQWKTTLPKRTIQHLVRSKWSHTPVNFYVNRYHGSCDLHPSQPDLGWWRQIGQIFRGWHQPCHWPSNANREQGSIWSSWYTHFTDVHGILVVALAYLAGGSVECANPLDLTVSGPGITFFLVVVEYEDGSLDTRGYAFNYIPPPPLPPSSAPSTT